MKDVKNHLKNVIRSVLRSEREAAQETTPFGYETTSYETASFVPAEMIGASSPVPKSKKTRSSGKKNHDVRIMRYH